MKKRIRIQKEINSLFKELNNLYIDQLTLSAWISIFNLIFETFRTANFQEVLKSEIENN